MSKLQRFQASVAEIFIFGSIAVFVWQFSDWIVNRSASCTTGLILPNACYTTSSTYVGNPNYHFNLWVFVAALVALVIGGVFRFLLGTPFSGHSKTSPTGRAIRMIGGSAGALAMALIVDGIIVLIIAAFVPGKPVHVPMEYLLLVGWLATVALFSYSTWKSLVTVWGSFTGEQQYRKTSDEGLEQLIKANINILAGLISGYNSDPSGKKAEVIENFKLMLKCAILENFRREAEAEQRYENLRSGNDWLHKYYNRALKGHELEKTSA